MNDRLTHLFFGLLCTCIFSGCAAQAQQMPAQSPSWGTMSFEELEAQLRQGEADMLSVGIAPAMAMAGPVGGNLEKDSTPGPPAAGFEDDGDSIGVGASASASASGGADAGDAEGAAVEAEPSPAQPPSPSEPADESSHEEITTRTPNRRARRRQCQSVCDIAQTMCGLQTRICQLASQHSDKPRYRQVCSQAQGDCSNAQEACHACQ